MIVGRSGPAVVLDARVCAWLEAHAGLSSLRVRAAMDPAIAAQLAEIRVAAMAWRSFATGTAGDARPEPVARSDRWLSSGQAADLAGVSSSAIRKAVREGRLRAAEVGGRYRISREDLEHFKAARAA